MIFLEKLVIRGKRRLEGEIDIQGAKNSLLPILAATVLVEGVSVIHNCPCLSDVDAAIRILEYLGCKVRREKDTLYVDSGNITCYNIPQNLMREMRSSIIFLGSLLGRMKKAGMSFPGGCEIGLRPIDLHLSSLESLGVTIDKRSADICCEVKDKITPAVISLSFPSVGATENIILACALSEGRTTVLNAAREPEIADLAAFLNKCGCNITIDSKGTVIIDGVRKLHGCEYSVMPDRIVAITYMCAVGVTGGNVVLKNADPSSVMSVIPVFEKAGCKVHKSKNSIRIISDGNLNSVKDIRTLPYPGFPTDAQAPVMAMLSVARGTGIIVENIFESRYKHVPELLRMGANIKIEGKVAIIDGTEKLHGAEVSATDLRGGAALVVAALGAEGMTHIAGLNHIDRGYEKIEVCLKKVGADIERREEV